MIPMAHLLASPVADVADTHPLLPLGYTIVETSVTHQSLTVKEGLFREHASSLLSRSAMTAIGNTGLRRLANFFRLHAGWDGNSSKPIDLHSVEVFSSFFADTGFRADGLSVFMSGQGNVVVNWLDQNNQLIELEFLKSGVEYFVESTGEEGAVSKGSIGFSELLKLLGA